MTRQAARWGWVLTAAVIAAACAGSVPTNSPILSQQPVVVAPTRTGVGDCCAAPTAGLYGLVTARPSRDPADVPAASERPTPTATPADSLSQDSTDQFDEMVSAGASISVPIDFEGSSWGSAMVYARADGLRVTFAGKPLESSPAGIMGPTGRAFGVASANPANGTLVITNTTGAPMEAAGYASIMTRRHVSVKPSVVFPKVGQVTSFDVSLTEPTASDDITVSTIGPTGMGTPATVTRLGMGHWTVEAAFATPGENAIRIQTIGTRIRVGGYQVSVAAGEVSIGSTFDEQVVDSDRDGLIDMLVLTPTITVLAAGKYMANAKLLDASGAEVTTNGQGEMSLAAGSQPLRLEFDGGLIYESRRWGPYTLEVTIWHDTTPNDVVEIADARLGQTAAYDYLQFQHDPISLDRKSFATKPIDTNGDGLYEELDFTGTVTVEAGGVYVIDAGLYAEDPSAYVAFAVVTVSLHAGANTFTLVFKGSDIAKSGRDGPYLEQDLLAYRQGDPSGWRPSDLSPFRTAPYKASQFAR